MKKIIFVVIFLLGSMSLIFAQNVTLDTQGYVGNSLIFNGWGESHFIRNESIDNTPNGRSRLRMYLTDDWTYDQGFEIIAKKYDGLLRTLLYIPGDGSQTNFFSGASFGGNVGIGTTNPNSKFVIMNDNYGISFSPANVAAGIGFNRNASDGTIFNTSISAWQFSARDGMFTLEGYNGPQNELFAVLKNGNVGIGTFNPSDKLHVAGQAQFDSNILLGHTGDNSLIRNREVHQTLDIGSTNYTTFSTYTSDWIERMRIVSNGNVGIGTMNPLNKLDVNGTVHSKEVKVDMIGWSDFVFKKGYTLPTLEEVEKQIAEKGHLANIPSEDEVLKNGINLGEMNSKLLQKIEELTLYVIEMKKESENIKNVNEKQNEEIQYLKKQISQK